MSLSKINDRFYRKFLMNHLDNKFNEEDLFDVIMTLNPANNKYKTKTEAEMYSDNSYSLDMKIAYKFRTEQSAKLFRSSYENLIQKGKSLLNVKQKGDIVMISLKEPVLVNHKVKNIRDKSHEEKLSNAIGYKEESQLISDIFIRTVDQMLNSGIYQMADNKPSRLQKRQVSNSQAFEMYEKKINQNKNESLYSFYKRTMFGNAIESNSRINNEIVKEISQAMEDRVNRKNASLLINRLFRNLKANSLSNILNMKNPKIQSILKETNIIDQKAINETSLLRQKIQQITELFTTKPKEEKVAEKKVLKFKYK